MESQELSSYSPKLVEVPQIVRHHNKNRRKGLVSAKGRRERPPLNRESNVFEVRGIKCNPDETPDDYLCLKFSRERYN